MPGSVRIGVRLVFSTVRLGFRVCQSHCKHVLPGYVRSVVYLVLYELCVSVLSEWENICADLGREVGIRIDKMDRACCQFTDGCVIFAYQFEDLQREIFLFCLFFSLGRLIKIYHEIWLADCRKVCLSNARLLDEEARVLLFKDVPKMCVMPFSFKEGKMRLFFFCSVENLSYCRVGVKTDQSGESVQFAVLWKLQPCVRIIAIV